MRHSAPPLLELTKDSAHLSNQEFSDRLYTALTPYEDASNLLAFQQTQSYVVFCYMLLALQHKVPENEVIDHVRTLVGPNIVLAKLENYDPEHDAADSVLKAWNLFCTHVPHLDEVSEQVQVLHDYLEQASQQN